MDSPRRRPSHVGCGQRIDNRLALGVERSLPTRVTAIGRRGGSCLVHVRFDLRQWGGQVQLGFENKVSASNTRFRSMC